MDDETLNAMENSLHEVRDEVRRALAGLEEALRTMTIHRRGVEIQAEKVRNTAYEALAEMRHLDKQLRKLDKHK